MTILDSLVGKALRTEDPVVAIASAADREVLESVRLAVAKEMASFMLIGDEEKLYKLLETEFQSLLPTGKVTVHHAENETVAAALSVKAVSDGRAHVLMKGDLATSTILKAVLNSEYGLRTGKILSHVAAFEVPGYDRLLFVTDAAMNIAPDLEAKAQIVRNAVAMAHACGVKRPIVSPLAAVETINSAMVSTTDAASLVMMNQRGQITGCLIDGPLALDIAVSERAAAQKGITGDTAGKADILLVPAIEAGNILYKSLMYFANAKVGAVVQGAKAPIVLTSRADSSNSKVYSLALAILASQ
ncbi:phosphate butyryltransferase [Sporosarcina sp. ACRSM]|uniref:phosphate butyryltransferase n=1 Tax=Sporosarcina sp. ACRSM TaxID=2918216 RepID=UPI001EF5F2A1|nr:phosphate butyryltransferase [Sporosarcina sp. ACRSM]MCG7336329.1 phosphate butyryltransferase [Sporosarcina sp. ACRSM]